MPLNVLKHKYPNNYKEVRCDFIAEEIKKVKVKVRSEDNIIVVETLKFNDPTIFSQDIYKAKYGNIGFTFQLFSFPKK